MTGAKYSHDARTRLMEWLSLSSPFSAVVHLARGMLLEVEDDTEAAREEFRQALQAGLSAVSPCQAAVIEIERELMLPQMVNNPQAAAQSFSRFQSGLQRLAAQNISFGGEIPAHQDCFLRPVYFPAPYLADVPMRDEFQILGSILHKAIPALQGSKCKRITPTSKPPRIGFISSFFHASSNGHTWGPLITRMPLNFTVVVVSLSDREDLQSQSLRSELRESDEYISLAGRTVDEMRTRILEAELDVAVYVGLGMDTMTWLLAAGSKLAPVQGATWGHSVTSGLPLDFYVSIRGAEVARAADRYTERRLFLFEGLSVYFSSRHVALRRKGTHRKGRNEFGLPDRSSTIYLYPHTLYKMQPEYDTLLRQILLQDDAAVVVVVETRKANRLSDRVFMRLMAAVPRSVHHRLVLLRTLGPTWDLGKDFLDLLDVADVLLDSFPWGGCTTTFEAFQLGQPVVTMPSGLLRGRFTVAMYRELNEERLTSALVAKDPPDFVRLALRLGKDPGMRRELRGLLDRAVQASSLFDDRRAVEQWSAALSGELLRVRGGGG